MGDAEIYQRLNAIETTISAIQIDLLWIKRFAFWMFGAGGLVGAAIAILITRG